MNDLIKETYCLFGLAYYQSEVLHRGLCNAYSLLTFGDPSHATRARIEEKLSESFSMTLGRVIAASRGFFPSDIQARLDGALEMRNFLAHRFWFERIHLMYSADGLLGLQSELADLVSLFEDLDTDISLFLAPVREQFGVNDDLIEQEYAELVAGQVEEPLICQRKLKKTEQIVKAWIAEHPDGAVTHIFESADGILWQLCDVGLGWTKFEKPSLNWRIDEKVQRYLPSPINPRPDIEEPWNYEFRLAEGAIFWVKLSEKERKYHCGIRLEGC